MLKKLTTNGCKPLFPGLLIFIFFCLFSGILVFLLTRILIYTHLPVQSISAQKGKGDWYKVEHTFLESGAGNYFIEKKYDIVFTENKAGNLNSMDDIITYFDTWFLDHDWKKFNGFLPQPCFNFLPESDLLIEGKSRISTYFKSDSKDPFLYQPTVCLLILEDETDGNVNKDSVVLLTARPTALTSILNVFR